MSSESKALSGSVPCSLPLPDWIRTYDISYQFVCPEEYGSRGIDPEDVPVGTFVAENHPPFLVSRFGGNAYGLGIIEHQDKLGAGELEFLEGLDFSDPSNIKRSYRRINTIYRKLGLLIRFSRYGERYFLIPIDWVSHSLQDIKDKVDEIEQVLLRCAYERKKEKLKLALLAASHDLIVHEISSRMPAQKFVLIDSARKLQQARGPFDLVLIAKDLDDLLLSFAIQSLAGPRLSRDAFVIYGTYLAGKIYDLLAATGELFIIASKPFPRTAKEVWVEFRDPEELRNFLLFTHVFKPRKRYRASRGTLLRVHLADFYAYLSGIFVYREDLKRVVGPRDPMELTLEEIDRLPRLDLKMSHWRRADLERRWQKVLAPFFEKISCYSKLTPSLKANWEQNYIIESELPDNLQIYLGCKRRPPGLLQQLEQEVRASGMAGCPLSLVAAYRNTFDYVFAVLEVLAKIRDKRFGRLSKLDLNRLHRPFAGSKNRYRVFREIKELMRQSGRLRRLEKLLNPGGLEGSRTVVLENIDKLALLGFPPALLREIYLIVVGHSSMGRITFGKLPEKSLKSITDQARHRSLEEMTDLLATLRLMSLAEVAAALGERLTREQGRELFALYDAALRVAADPNLNWEKLHEQQIAALGGAQNLALRQMLKIFNLFEYLDSWMELTDKGPFQKEALAEYSPEKLEQINQVLQLIQITNEFKERFYGVEAFSRPYFFRKLLECRFHGTGQLLPALGTRAGFILLWISVNASPGNVINFNPLVGYEQTDAEQKQARVRSALASLRPEQLHFGYLEELKEALVHNQMAFVFDSGIQFRYERLSQATEVFFVDVEDDLKKMQLFQKSAAERPLADMPVAQLQEADRLFGELLGYWDHLEQQAARGKSEGRVEARAELGRCCCRLEEMFAHKLLLPERLFDTVESLYKYCPNIGGRILGEFWDLDRIRPAQERYAEETIPAYILRCLKKFQALVNRDRQAMQDTDIFYQLAQQQFGPMVGECVGASSCQIDLLEEVVERIGTRPGLMKALGAALLFQEIGKLPLYLEEYRPLSTKYTHASAGAEILRRKGILQRLGMDRPSRLLAEFLVEGHGLFGHVLRGEVALPALEVVTGPGDEVICEAFFLHSVIAAAGFREGLMVEDLLDRFFELRRAALGAARREVSWQAYIEQLLVNKGENLLGETEDTAGKQGPLALFSDWDRLNDREGLRRKGEEAAALERLFRLVGVAEIGLTDVQMRYLNLPATFIYHKKGLKSTGVQKFEEDLEKALAVHQAVMALEERIRRTLLQKLSPSRDLVRIYGFEYVARHLEPGNWLKLLLLAFRAVERHAEDGSGPHAVNFQDLGLVIDRRHQALAEELAGLQLERLFKDGRLLSRFFRASVGVILRYSREDGVVTLEYRDRLQVERIIERLEGQEDISRLKQLYHRELKRLRSLAYPTEDYQRLLSQAFHRRLEQLIELSLSRAEKRMRRQRRFSGLERILAELMLLAEENVFSEEQMQLLRDMYEFNLDRLRSQRLQAIQRHIQACGSSPELMELWSRIRVELIHHRRHLGREFESLVTRRFDEQLLRLQSSQATGSGIHGKAQ